MESVRYMDVTAIVHGEYKFIPIYHIRYMYKDQ